MVAGKVAAELNGLSQLKVETTHSVACRQSVVNQLIPTSLLLRSAAQTGELGQRIQTMSLIFRFYAKPSSW